MFVPIIKRLKIMMGYGIKSIMTYIYLRKRLEEKLLSYVFLVKTRGISLISIYLICLVLRVIR